MNNTEKLEFNKRISVNFDGGEITGNAGLLVLEEFVEKIGLKELLKKYFPEQRKGNFEHKKYEIIYQKIIRIITGRTSNNNYIYQKNDPIFNELHNNKIASSSTCSRLEQTFNYSDINSFKKINKTLEKYNLEQNNTKKVIVDIDTTYDPASENLEFSRFNGHYSLNGFSPILAFNGLTGDFISGTLRPGNYHCSILSYNFISEIIKLYEYNKIDEIIFRLDSAFSIHKILNLFEEKNIKFYSKLKNNSNLLKMVEGKGKRGVSTFINLEYKASTWDKSRRVVACIDWKAREIDESKKNRKKNPKLKAIKQYDLFPIYSFVVTNDLELENEEIFSMYNGRATIENSIEEGKNGFEMDHLSNKSFKINSVNYQIHLLALQLIQLFRKITLAKPSNYIKNSKHKKTTKLTKKFKGKKIGRKEIIVPHIQTIRQQVFNIPAKIVKTGRKVYYKCASCFPFKDLFFNILDKIHKLNPLII